MDAVSNTAAAALAAPGQRDDPRRLTDFLERLAPLYGLGDELAPLRALATSTAVLPLEASVSLDGGASPLDLRCTLGVPALAQDHEGRAVFRTVLDALGADPASAAAEDALVHAERGAPTRQFRRGLALRVRPGCLGFRVGCWLGGDTVGERSVRVENALRSLELEAAAQSHAYLATVLGSNPFSATIPYGLGLHLRRHGVGGAKTYFACEWAEVLLSHVHGPIAQALGLEGRTAPFDVLVAATGPEWRRARWLLETSFELPADQSRGARVKLYVPPSRLAASGAGAHRTILRVATDLGLDCAPYEELLRALRPCNRSVDPATLMLGVSVSAAGASLEAYVFVRPWQTNHSARVTQPGRARKQAD